MKNLNTAPAGDTAVSTFNFRGFDLRCVLIDGDPWFAASDVCSAIGIKNSSSVLSNLQTLEVRRANLASGRARPNNLINERGFYEIVSRAQRKNPKAREFQDWVFGEVLPAIRKDGGYIEDEEKVRTGDLSEEELIFKAMEVMRKKIDRLATENDAMLDELTQVTVAEYAALNHVYFTRDQKAKLSLRARKMVLDAGGTIIKSPRVVTVRGQLINTAVNVYSREVLDRAAKEMGLFTQARGSMRPVVSV